MNATGSRSSGSTMLASASQPVLHPALARSSVMGAEPLRGYSGKSLASPQVSTDSPTAFGRGTYHHDSSLEKIKPSEVITPCEHDDWCSRMWARMDRDQSESITTVELDCDEFRNILRGVLAPSTTPSMGGSLYHRVEMNMNQAINFCMRKADLNDDISLSFQEFKAFMLYLRQNHLKKDTAGMIFALFDLDVDGLIDESEFREIYRFYLGHIPTEKEFQAEWARLDLRGDQKATRVGYIQWLQTSTNPIFKQHAPVEMASPESSMGTLPGLSRSSKSLRMRPKWNQRFNYSSSPSNIESRKGQRQYFSRPQTLPELMRHMETHQGFGRARKRLQEVEPRRRSPLLSTDADSGFELLPERAIPTGTMRNKSTGKAELWQDYWQTQDCIKSQYQPGTLDLRCPGPPPGQSVHAD